MSILRHKLISSFKIELIRELWLFIISDAKTKQKKTEKEKKENMSFID